MSARNCSKATRTVQSHRSRHGYSRSTRCIHGKGSYCMCNPYLECRSRHSAYRDALRELVDYMQPGKEIKRFSVDYDRQISRTLRDDCCCASWSCSNQFDKLLHEPRPRDLVSRIANTPKKDVSRTCSNLCQSTITKLVYHPPKRRPFGVVLTLSLLLFIQ